MLEGRRCEDWDHTATLLAMIANVARSKKQKAAKPMDFHPYRSRSSRAASKPVTAEEWSSLGKSLVKSGQFKVKTRKGEA